MKKKLEGSGISLIEKFEKTGFIDLEKDLHPPVYRVNFPVRCFLRFKVPCHWDGQTFAITGSPLRLNLNGKEILNILFQEECGIKKASVDLTPLLNEGDNVLEACATVFNNVLPRTWGKVFLINQSEMKILRTFNTRNLFEELSDKWILHFAK